MSPDDDRIWLEVLAGRAPAAGGDAAVGDDASARGAAAREAAAREAEGLRAGILARAVDAAEPVAPQDLRREDALIARARREGLLPAGAGARPERRVAGWRTLVAAAAAILVVVAAGVVMRRAPERETVRSAAAGPVRLEAPDPQALQRLILEDLRVAGVRATPYERLGRFGLDADLPVPVPEPIAEVLRRHGIPVPADGVLSVEIAGAP